jgi:hypothetical protein
MNLKKLYLVTLFGLATGTLSAQTVAPSTPTGSLSGESANVYNAISTWFNFLDPNQGAAALLNYIANLFFNCLLWLYNFIGTFLIPIPDVSQASTFLNGSYQIAYNIYLIFFGFGLYVTVCCLVINVGVLASGLGRGAVSFGVIVRSFVAVGFLVGWPAIFSLSAQVFTAAGYLVFGQNTIQTAGVFNSLQVMGTSTVTNTANQNLVQSNNSVQNNIPNTSGTITQGFKSFWSVLFPIACALGLVGILYGGWMFSRGDPQGLKILGSAVFGLLIITSAQTLIGNFLSATHGLIQQGQINASQEITSGHILFPSSAGGGGTVPSSGGVANALSNTALITVSALLKILISLVGALTCVGVIVAKFIQIGTLLILFMLGPTLAGFIAHPSTEHIAINGLKMMFKQMLNSVIWGLALVILYLLTNINYGSQSIGGNNLMISFAVLAGLELIKNSERFAELFASGMSVGQGHSTWGNFTSGATGMISGAIGGVATISGLAASAAGVGAAGASGAAGAAAAGAVSSTHMQLAGAALGSMTPFVGTAGGQKLGQAGANLMNTIDKLSQGPTQAPGASDAGTGLDLKQTNRLMREMANKLPTAPSSTPAPPSGSNPYDIPGGKKNG